MDLIKHIDYVLVQTCYIMMGEGQRCCPQLPVILLCKNDSSLK